MACRFWPDRRQKMEYFHSPFILFLFAISYHITAKLNTVYKLSLFEMILPGTVDTEWRKETISHIGSAKLIFIKITITDA